MTEGVDNPAPYNVLSFCAGVGGLDLGIHIACGNARTVCYVEREAAACETLAARMEDGTLSAAPAWSDAATFDGKPWGGIVDCILSGDPCQPNSVAGKGLGEEDDRWLLDQLIRIVKEVRPARLFRENVPGRAHGQIGYLVPALEGLGYRIAAGIFSAEEVGFSHRRERLFIMADLDGTRRAASRSGSDHGEGFSERQGEIVGRGDVREEGKTVAARRRYVADTDSGRRGREGDTGASPEVGNAAGVVLDDASRKRWRKGRTEPVVWGGRGSVGGSDSTLAHNAGQRCGEAGREHSERSEERTDLGEHVLGNADHGRDGRNEAGARGEAIGRDVVDGTGCFACGPVDDTDQPVVRELASAWQQSEPEREYETGCLIDQLPLAAPGPSNPRWADIVRYAPHLEPAVRRVDARMASRVDELRAAGNGVTSLAAAFAWTTLEATLRATD